MRNVIVFAAGSTRYAVELRWVREMFNLGYVTPVPRAPATVIGVVNFRGAIVPVLDVDVLYGRQQPLDNDGGDGAILIEVNDITAALRATRVIEVSSLPAAPGDADEVIDSTGHQVPVLDPPEIVRRAGQNATSVAREGVEKWG